MSFDTSSCDATASDPLIEALQCYKILGETWKTKPLFLMRNLAYITSTNGKVILHRRWADTWRQLLSKIRISEVLHITPVNGETSSIVVIKYSVILHHPFATLYCDTISQLDSSVPFQCEVTPSSILIAWKLFNAHLLPSLPSQLFLPKATFDATELSSSAFPFHKLLCPHLVTLLANEPSFCLFSAILSVYSDDWDGPRRVPDGIHHATLTQLHFPLATSPQLPITVVDDTYTFSFRLCWHIEEYTLFDELQRTCDNALTYPPIPPHNHKPPAPLSMHQKKCRSQWMYSPSLPALRFTTPPVWYHLSPSNAYSKGSPHTSQPRIWTQPDFRCPLCSLWCSSFASLLVHFVLCHDRLLFRAGEANQYVGYSANVYMTLSPHLFAHIPVKVGEAFAWSIRYTRKLLLIDKFVDSITPIFSKWRMRTSKEPNMDLTSLLHASGPYYHSVTNHKIKPGELFYDSENEELPADESDMTTVSMPSSHWRERHHEQQVDEYTDVPRADKVFAKLWNRFVRRRPIRSDSEMEAAAEAFVENVIVPLLSSVERDNDVFHRERAGENGRFWVLHSTKLALLTFWDYKILSTAALRRCISRVVDAYRLYLDRCKT